ncbi:MAG: nitroreductase/quinone reductase family protein [Halioglobus sp.]|nr:nitroreductase/quinone reductase family protein [Halioglobus sp.]
MPTNFANIEQAVFRNINAVVEPTVRRGFGSPTFAPAGLIVLETKGFKSGMRRRTPLWSFRLGRYRLVSTGRGDRSFWVKNVLQQPRVNYYLGGRRRAADAIVITRSALLPDSPKLSPSLQKMAAVLSSCAPEGWAFVLLVPVKR